MSIHSHLIKKPDGTSFEDGWQVRVRQRNPRTGTLEARKKNFPASKGFKLRDAERYERELLGERDDTELKMRFGPPTTDRTAADDAARDRTIEDMATYYCSLDCFTELAPASRQKIRSAIQEFLQWNQLYGRPYARDWTPELAQKRLYYLRHEAPYHALQHTDARVGSTEGVTKAPEGVTKGHRGQGVAFHAIYNKKLFSIELERKPSAIAENPWPALKRKHADVSQLDPRAYTPEEIFALFAVMDPYEKLLFQFLYATGCRSSELLHLRRERITLDAMRQPTHVTFVKTKNHKPRTVRLNEMARDAVAGLLLDGGGPDGSADGGADERSSGFLVRREFLFSKSGNRIKSPLLDALDRVKLRAAQRFPEHRHAFLERVDPEDPRSRFVTNVHTFRATFVTELLLKNVNVAVIARLIGDTVGTLLNHYAGLLARGEEEAVHLLPNIKHYETIRTTDRPIPA